MAKAKKANGDSPWKPTSKRKQKRTSIGNSSNSRPLNKNKKRLSGKRGYRGQGK